MNVRPLTLEDLPAARRIFQLAFGTERGVADPAQYLAGRDYVSTRWRAGPAAAFGAEIEGRLAGAAFAVNWGSLGLFGPLTIHPDYWNRGVAHALIEPCLSRQMARGARYQGLYTAAGSPKHLWLYQKFGYWPRFLTAIMSKPTSASAPPPAILVFSKLDKDGRVAAMGSCRELTGEILEGLDLTGEIAAVDRQKLGDTLLLESGSGVDAFAVCHCGEGTEAGAGNCYVKFGAARDAASFRRLLLRCEAFAVTLGLGRLVAGVNTARREAYRELFDLGFRTDVQGVGMHRDDEPVYNRPGVFVIDDWR